MGHEVSNITREKFSKIHKNPSNATREKMSNSQKKRFEKEVMRNNKGHFIKK
jgi:hypothetical protein